ncbi:MAG: molybdopterin-dependent oxidoreductase [Isosphaeraceae bacterium]
MTAALLAAVVLAFPQAPAQAPPQVQVESLPLRLESWKRGGRVDLVASEQGQSATYTGVPLKAVLEAALQGKPEMEALRSLSDAVLIVQGSDGYQALVSAAAVAMDSGGKKYLLAWERDGKPLSESEGSLRLIVPGDDKRVRWVRKITAISLVRLPKLPKPAAP